MSSDLKAKLAQLKALHELGLLTEADFANQKRAPLAAAMVSTPASPTRPSPLPPAAVHQHRAQGRARPACRAIRPLQ